MIREKRGGNSSAQRGKDSGVSEIIGDILILGITVVLFTSIFFYVNAIPTPTAQTYADFQATISQPFTNGLTTQEMLNVTHLGGQTLNAGSTAIIVQINQTVEVYQMGEGNGFSSNGDILPWTSTHWIANQIWSVNETNVSTGSIVSVSVINKASNYVVWSTVITGRSNIAAPVVQNAYATPNPVTPGRNLTVIAIVLGNAQYVNASVYYMNHSAGTIRLQANAGIYSGTFRTVGNLISGEYYPIQINATSNRGQEVNYSFETFVSNNGPAIITASINPSPTTPGGYFNFTAYVTDTNSSEFNPEAGIGTVRIDPYGTPLLTNVTANGSNAVQMVPSVYSGIFTYPARVNLNVYGFETFIINATDNQGNSAFYYVTLVVLNTLNPGFLNSSYPSTYLGPASMTYSNFKWYPAGSPQDAVSGYSVPLSALSKGIYFQLQLTNHNTSDTLYLDDLTNVYVFDGATVGFGNAYSFVVLNGTTGASFLTPASNYAGYQPNTYSGATYTYPSLEWPLPSSGTPSANWVNYSVTGTSPSSTSFLTLPAAVGGVQVDVQVIFGAAVAGTGSSISIPATIGGPFTMSTNNLKPFISTNFVGLFGYLLPYQVMPWSTFPTSGAPFGQTIPFSGIYWY